MPDRICHSCREPWDITMEPDASIKAVRQWLDDEYGEGFKVSDMAGVMWAIMNCPSCPDGAQPDPDAIEEDMLEMI